MFQPIPSPEESVASVLPHRAGPSGRQGTVRDGEMSGPVSPLSTHPTPMTPDPDAPHVLVMDGTPELLDLIGQILSDEGYRVTLASWPLDPADIVGLAPDLIIMEAIYNLQNVGIPYFTELRATAALSHIPVICCTALRPLPYSLAMRNASVIAKPFDVDELVAEVASMIDRVRTCPSQADGG